MLETVRVSLLAASARSFTWPVLGSACSQKNRNAARCISSRNDSCSRVKGARLLAAGSSVAAAGGESVGFGVEGRFSSAPCPPGSFFPQARKLKGIVRPNRPTRASHSRRDIPARARWRRLSSWRGLRITRSKSNCLTSILRDGTREHDLFRSSYPPRLDFCDSPVLICVRRYRRRVDPDLVGVTQNVDRFAVTNNVDRFAVTPDLVESDRAAAQTGTQSPAWGLLWRSRSSSMSTANAIPYSPTRNVRFSSSFAKNSA